MLKRLWAALLALFAPPEPGQTFRARITNVQDGDSLEFSFGLRGYRGRLVGIDAPEHTQAFGLEAAQHLIGLAYASNDVTIEHVGYDKFNRMLVRVTVGAVDLAEALLEAGFAWHIAAYSKQMRPIHAGRYAAAACRAREAGRGLWAQPHPMSPAQYRAISRGSAPPQPPHRKPKASRQGNLFT
jgi:micrococcal nuclease